MSASVNEVIANDLRKSHALLQRAVGGLKPAEFEVQPCPGRTVLAGSSVTSF